MDTLTTNVFGTIFFTVVYIVAGVLQTEIIQIATKDLNEPLVFRYVNSSTNALFLLFALECFHPKFVRSRRATSLSRITDSAKSALRRSVSNKSRSAHQRGGLLSPAPQLKSNILEVKDQQVTYMSPAFDTLTLKETWRDFNFRVFMRKLFPYAVVATIGMTGGGMTWYLSLEGTTIPTNFAMNKLRAIWAFILSYFFIGEEITKLKMSAILVSLSGVVCFIFEIKHRTGPRHAGSFGSTSDTFWGAGLALLSGFLWAVADVNYSVAYEKVFPTFRTYGTLMFQATQGVLTFLCFWFVIFVPLRGTSLSQLWTHEHVGEIWAFVVTAGVAMAINEWAFCMMIGYSSPVIANAAGLFLLPASLFADVFIHGYKVTYLAALGMILIAAGFVMLEILPSVFEKREMCGYSQENYQSQV